LSGGIRKSLTLTTREHVRLRSQRDSARWSDSERFEPFRYRPSGFRMVEDCQDECERLRLESLSIFDAVPCQKPQHQSPAVAALAVFTEIPVICPDGRPLAEFLYLIGFVKQAGILVFGRHEADKLWRCRSRFLGCLLAVNA